MKILILHLSDLHIKDRNGINTFQIKKIVDVVVSMGQFDRAILIVSGDIAYSGTKDQYKYAKNLLGGIIRNIMKATQFRGLIDIMCVPGNHDINHGGYPRDSAALQEIRNNNKYESCLGNELRKQEDFFNLANLNKCFLSKGVFDQRILDYNGIKVEINLFNSGVFSIIEEDKGLHYLPTYCINEFEKPSGADLVLTVMHHAPDWFIDEQKNNMERAIYNKSAIVFLGHEHYLGSKALAFSQQQRAIIQAGGCLCNNDDWSNSSFHVGVIDTDNLTYYHGEYKWNKMQHQYESLPLNQDQLPNKPSVEKTLRLTDEYYRSFIEDSKHSIVDDFSQYFVFPRIQSSESIKDKQKEFITEDSFALEIKNKRRVIINGFDNSGKTALLKHLFLHFYNNGFIPIFCDIESIKGKKPEKIIKNCFEDIYGDDPSNYIRYQQLPKEKKIVFVDDIDQIQSKCIDAFFAYLSDSFELCVFSAHDSIDLSLLDRMKAQFNTGDSIPKYKIEPMYADKRIELIQRIVEIKVADASAHRRTVNSLALGIAAQRQFFNLDPDFIIKYVEYFINNLGEATNSDSNIFSKVFEANLINSICSHNKTKLSTDKIFILLSKVAYYIHFQKAYPISEKHIYEVINQYNLSYGDSVTPHDFLNVSIASKIILLDEEIGGYRFVNKNYLAYFVAREVNREYNETGDETKLRSLLQYACFGINTDILLFITYITDNIRILRLLLLSISDLTDSWDEFSFDNDKLPDFLKGNFGFTLDAPSEEDKKQESEAEVDAERKSTEYVQTTGIYDYSEDDADKLVNQFIRATHLLSVAARCLPNFEHMMLKPDKEQFVNVIYGLPNRVFNIWAKETNKEVDHIIEFFKKQSQEYFSRKKPLSDDEIKAVLQWSAISLLLDLYNLSVLFSTKETTMPLLTGFDYQQKTTYSVEHLMMLERQSSVNSFLDEADRITEGTESLLEKTVVKRVVEHAMIKRDDFTHSQLDRAKGKYFPNKQSQQRIMAKRFAANKNGDK